MPHPVFSDTIQDGTKYARYNIYGQAIFMSFGWSWCHLTKKKSEARKTLYMVFKRNSIPSRMIVDNSKEQSLREFRRKWHEAD